MIHLKTFEEHQYYSRLSRRSPDEFWAQVAQHFLWQRPWDKTRSGDFSDPGQVRWFEGARLNITENCLDRHLPQRKDQVAIYWEPNGIDTPARQFTYEELLHEVCKVALGLKKLGVKKGDRVVLYMSMVPELLFSVLACARLGAVHSVVFGGFSAKSLEQRINDCGARLVITNDEGLRGDKVIGLKKIVDEALKNCPQVEHTLMFAHTGSALAPEARDISWSELAVGLPQNCFIAAEKMDAEDPLFILYTSGSTGKPKGLLHTCAGYMVYAEYSFRNVFQMNEGDLFWCTADLGWITGHTYLTYAPLLAGQSQVMFEGIPTYPDPGRFWQVIDKYKVSHFYTAPTAIRSLMALGEKFVQGHHLTSLKVLGSVGEPINAEAWHWYHEWVGKKKTPIVDTWWQTETGGILISAVAGVTPSVPTFATLPLPGIEPILVDEKGVELSELNTGGNLCIKNPWPSIARTIYGDPERFKHTYFSTYPGLYFTGDGALRDSKGNFRITGRVDDVLNVSGHRIGTAEVENALNQHPDIVESAVVGFPHDIKGQGIFAYVVCRNKVSDGKAFQQSVAAVVSQEIGPLAKPDRLLLVEGLPKTRSGKIMRRILRKIAEGDTENLGDTSTLLNPEIVEQIKKAAKK